MGVDEDEVVDAVPGDVGADVGDDRDKSGGAD
jgi:hypothetical protein